MIRVQALERIGKVTCRVDQRLILEADRRLDSTR